MKNVSASCCQQLHIFTAIPVLSNSTTSRSPCLGTKQDDELQFEEEKIRAHFQLGCQQNLQNYLCR